jgi:two-component sensor histidine kinase
MVPAQLSANRLVLDGAECVCLIATDLSEQKRSQEIVAAERLARSILEQTAGAILVADPSGRIVRASRASDEMAAGTVLLRQFDEVFCLRGESGQQDYTLKNIVSMVQRCGSIAGLEATAKMRDGRALDVMLSASLLTGANSECLGCIVLLSDVSDLKHAEEAVRQLSEQRGLVLEAGKLGVWDYQNVSGYVFWDERCRNMFGIRSGRHIQYDEAIARIHADDRDATREAVSQALAGGNGGAYQREFRVVWPDDSIHWVASYGQAFFEGSGDRRRAVRLVGVNHEITERKNLEEARLATVRALEAAVKEKTVLLKEIHHRVKNNLAVISSLLSMKARAIESPDVRLALEESQQRVRSIALVHEQLYRSASLDRINLTEYVHNLTEGLCSTLAGEPGRISMEMDVDPIEIDINRAVPCALILNELLTNAFKYAFPDRREGRIRVSFRESEPGFLQLTIEDDGIGLPAGRLADRNTQSLGLRIVAILADQLDGSLEQQPCSGTRIVLRFPSDGARPVVLAAAPDLLPVAIPTLKNANCN